MSGTTLPTVMAASGLQPTPPATIRSNLVASVAATNPGYSANLPGSLVEDIASTDTAAIVLCDQARVELVNSITPYGANPFLLQQLGQIYGVPPGQTTNTSVYVVFTGTVGFVIQAGFTVSDGTYQYVVQNGGIIGSSGQSEPLLAVANQGGAWPVPAGTVTQFYTGVPTGITLSVTNPQDGTPATAAETEENYRARVLQAGLVAATGTPAFLKTLLQNIPGVLARLVAVRLIPGIGYEVICGGSGDPYAIAYAIYRAVPDLASATGSVMSISGITRANPGVVTTVLNHGYTTGQVVTFSGVGGMTELNTGNYTITVIDEKTFSIGVDTSSYPAYTSGGEVLPNLRNVPVTITNYPDQYTITFVNPPQQTVTVNLAWNTIATGFVSSATVNQLAQQAIITYINDLPVGAPINLFAMEDMVQQAVAPVLSIDQLSRMVFTVSINGVATPPVSGTGVIEGDPESYMYASAATVTVSQG